MGVLDVGIWGLSLLVLAAIGQYFFRLRPSFEEFVLADRQLKGVTLGFSLTAALLAAGTVAGFVVGGYTGGVQVLLIPLAFWLVAPLLVSLAIPLLRRLQLKSVLEYLELRFGKSVRGACAATALVWRLLWLSAVLAACGELLAVACAAPLFRWLLPAAVGVAGAAFTLAGGIKAIACAGVLHVCLLALALCGLIGALLWGLDEGSVRVSEVAAALGRFDFVGENANWKNYLSLLGILAGSSILLLAWHLADAMLAQHYLAGADENAGRTAAILHGFLLTLFAAGGMYAGLALLAYYHDNPQAMRANWVVNLNGKTGESLTPRDVAALRDAPPGPRDQPLIGWEEEVSSTTIAALIEQQKLLHPHSKQPFSSAEDLLNEEGELDIAALAMRSPQKGTLKAGPWLLHNKSSAELLPHFIRQTPPGLFGLLVAGLIAAAWSSFSAGLLGAATSLSVDVRPQASSTAQAKTVRRFVILLGMACIVFALIWNYVGLVSLTLVAGAVAGPLLAVFLLGAATRRTSAAGALTGLICGVLAGLCFPLLQFTPAAPWLDELGDVSAAWQPMIAFSAALMVGLAVGHLAGSRPRLDQIRGLVAGVGYLGLRDAEEASIAIELKPPATIDDAESRWR